MWNSIKQLSGLGHRITFIAPNLDDEDPKILEETSKYLTTRLVSCRPGRLLPTMVRAQLTGRPLSILRHSHDKIRKAVKDELENQQVDVIHAEQVQALHNIPAEAGLPPVVLRAQNVESHLWRMVAAANPKLGFIARAEARKMAVIEAESVRRAGLTIVLTRPDGEALAGGLGMTDRKIRVVPPPFPGELPTSDIAFEGEPAITLLGGGWLPNRDSTRWFFDSIWSSIREENPGAHVHVFGSDPDLGQPSATWHSPPNESRNFFHHESVLVVPLRIASGIRMKIIEAWARGIPVVATPAAVKGLAVRDDREVLLAANGAEFAAAIRRLRLETGLRERLTREGRSRLARDFDPASVSKELLRAYAAAITLPAEGGARAAT